MTSQLTWDSALRFTGTNDRGHETHFDTTTDGGGLDTASSPVEIVLQAVAACTAMDVVSILKKRRKQINSFHISLLAERAETHPKVFTHITMNFEIVSPDVTVHELESAIELSYSTYCSVSIMLQRSGVVFARTARVIRAGFPAIATEPAGPELTPMETQPS